jgi:hypothetical protein
LGFTAFKHWVDNLDSLLTEKISRKTSGSQNC